MGGYERDPAPWSLDGIPADFNGKLLPEDWERFEELMTNAIVRVPALENAEVVKLINGPEAFTPDGEFILGESDVRGFWVAAGFCAHGLAGAGGMGQLMAEWIVDGQPGLDTWEMDSRRFGPHYRSREYTLARTVEGYATYYDVKYPGQERLAGRPLRVSPAYERLAELGASFGEKSGWERANWFESNAAAGDESLRPRGWAGKIWSPAIGAEHRACRETAALFDETSFAKLDVTGAGAAEFLEGLCANRVARDVGQVTYTQMLNPRGGIECDFTVTRLAEERFRIVTGTAFGRHDLAWIRSHLPDDGAVQLEDVTSRFACFGLWGPAAREILQPLTDADLSFPYMRAREIVVGPVPCLAVRVTYVGELGWELYCPVRVRPAPVGRLWEAGSRARTCRGRLQGDRLAAPGEGLPRLGRGHLPRGHAVRGRARLRRQARQGRVHRARGARGGARSRSGGSSASPSRIPARSRSARSRCGSTARSPGRVTSGGYGYTVERSIAYAYVPAEAATPGRAVEVEIFGEWIAGEVAEEPLFDPERRADPGLIAVAPPWLVDLEEGLAAETGSRDRRARHGAHRARLGRGREHPRSTRRNGAARRGARCCGSRPAAIPSRGLDLNGPAVARAGRGAPRDRPPDLARERVPRAGRAVEGPAARERGAARTHACSRHRLARVRVRRCSPRIWARSRLRSVRREVWSATDSP